MPEKMIPPFSKESFWPVLLSFMIMGSSGLQVFTSQTNTDNIKDTVTSNITADVKLFIRESFDKFSKEMDGKYVTKAELKSAVEYLESRDSHKGRPVPRGRTLMESEEYHRFAADAHRPRSYNE